jgi:hypothetical protein
MLLCLHYTQRSITQHSISASKELDVTIFDLEKNLNLEHAGSRFLRKIVTNL